jgi:hypothetical protein
VLTDTVTRQVRPTVRKSPRETLSRKTEIYWFKLSSIAANRRVATSRV